MNKVTEVRVIPTCDLSPLRFRIDSLCVPRHLIVPPPSVWEDGYLGIFPNQGVSRPSNFLEVFEGTPELYPNLEIVKPDGRYLFTGFFKVAPPRAA